MALNAANKPRRRRRAAEGDSLKTKMGVRYNELRTGGMSCADAAARVNEEFHTSLREDTVRGYGSAVARTARAAQRSEPGEHSPAVAPSEPEEYSVAVTDSEPEECSAEEAHSEPEDGSAQGSLSEPEECSLKETRSEPGARSDLEAFVRKIARETCEEIMRNMTSVQAAAGDMPPEPAAVLGVKGRRQDRDYRKITLTIDKSLWDLFEAERKRLSVSAARMMDIVLWRHYGRPRLSFEKDEK